MTIIVAEYLGVRTDKHHNITPIKISKSNTDPSKPILACPFKNSHCEKAKRGDKPICSVRDSATNELWIVCPSRFCASMKGQKNNPIPLNDYQKTTLHEVAKEIYGADIERHEVLVDREVPIPVTDTSDYSADYVMWRRNPRMTAIGTTDRPVILEMQGGGETTSTGEISRHISQWELGKVGLTDPISKAAPLVTNAWRRQQEQFLVKGNTAMLTGGRIAFCVGSMIYDYLLPRLKSTTIFPSLKDSNWSLALITIKEDTSASPTTISPSAPQSIPLVIDPNRTLFTNYSFFVQAITNQGTACSTIFDREFSDLS